MLKIILKTIAMVAFVNLVNASDPVDNAVVSATANVTQRFLTEADLANADLMAEAHSIVAATPGFEHLKDDVKFAAHLATIQKPRVASDAIRMMLFFVGDKLKAVGAGGMMPLSVTPVYLDVPTTIVNGDGTVSVTAPAKLKFVEGQEAIVKQYKSLVSSQGIVATEQYNAGTPGSWSITNAFASTVTIATAFGYADHIFVAMHSAFFEMCRDKKLVNGQNPNLHICTLANGEGAEADFSATKLKKYAGSFPYYPADEARGKRVMLVGAYSDKPLP